MNEGLENQHLLESVKDQQLAIAELANNSSKRLLILSHAFEPEYYDQADFISACKNMVLGHRQCHIKVLVQNNEQLQRQDHRFLTLMQRLPSRIEIKLCHEDYRDHPETFMLSDYRGIFLKRIPGRSTAVLYRDAPRLNDEYSKLFYTIWEQSELDITLRRLSL